MLALTLDKVVSDLRGTHTSHWLGQWQERQQQAHCCCWQAELGFCTSQQMLGLLSHTVRMWLHQVRQASRAGHVRDVGVCRLVQACAHAHNCASPQPKASRSFVQRVFSHTHRKNNETLRLHSSAQYLGYPCRQPASWDIPHETFLFATLRNQRLGLLEETLSEVAAQGRSFA